jgi:flagellin
MSYPSSVLNTNIASMIAQRNLGGAQSALATSVERLSSGLRINRAKDDAAGMAVASVINSQIKISGTAHRNVNDAISMMQTAEGALQEATSMLQRIKELATQGANDSMSKEQYYFLVQEMFQLMQELGNVAGRTTFNGNNLLGGFAVADNGSTPTTYKPGMKIEGTPTAGQNGPWEFLTGAGTNDKMQIDLIPIFASQAEVPEGGYGGGAIEVGALNALYVRVAYLANTEKGVGGAIPTGRGFDVFSKSEEDYENARTEAKNNLTALKASAVPTDPVEAAKRADKILAAEREVEIFDLRGAAPKTELANSETADSLSLNDLVDKAILQINAHRSYFGAFYGRLEHNVANLSAITENLNAALSRVQDTDYGQETANLTRVQILQQAATAMLAQANAMPNVVLGLLRQQ